MDPGRSDTRVNILQYYNRQCIRHLEILKFENFHILKFYDTKYEYDTIR